MRLPRILLMFAASNVISVTFASEVNIDTYSASLDFAQVSHVQATQKSNGSWCFDTSVQHNDQGWGHYADGWEVIDLEGKLDKRLTTILSILPTNQERKMQF